MARYLSEERAAGTLAHNRKQAPHEALACYALLSYNTSTPASGGIAYYDKSFQELATVPTLSAEHAGLGPRPSVTYHDAGGLMGYAGRMRSWTSTHNRPSSAQTATFGNATNVMGEFGNYMTLCYSNLTANPQSSYQSAAQLNQGAINADHRDRAIVYVVRGGRVFGVNRLQPTRHASTHNQLYGDYPLPHLNTSMTGAGTYNARRKAFVVLSYLNTNGSFRLDLYQGVDLDRHRSVDAAFSGLTPSAYTLNLSSNWSVNNTESHYNLKPVLCDNGDVFISVMHPSNGLNLYKVTRLANGGYNAGEFVTRVTLTTSYGAEQNYFYGLRSLQSRDGSLVMHFCAYYYYGAGHYNIVIDKAKATYVTNLLASSNTNDGCQPLPYGDSGFAMYLAGQAHGSNPSGGYILGTYERRPSDGALLQTNATLYLPYFPYPDATNYPGITQVADYAVLQGQHTQPDHWNARGA